MLARRAKTGGFTAVELLLVLAIIALLASLAMPAVNKSIERANESALRENLQVIRKSLDAYYADNGMYPPSLEILTERRYIRSIPLDPVSERPWDLVWSESTLSGEPQKGIMDIRSSSDKVSRDGTRYSQW
jgi:general secretion pathway protein G